MVVVERLTKYAHFMSMSHPYISINVAQRFLDNVYKLHGYPASIVSDRDLIFMSILWDEFFKIQGVELKHSSVYHRQTNGQTEVVNRSLECYLSACLENYLKAGAIGCL